MGNITTDASVGQEKHSKLLGFFNSSLESATWQDFRKNAVQCFKYRESDQWTSAEKQELEDRGQPATVNNQVKITLDRMLGSFLSLKSRIKFKPRNSPQDDALAEALSDTVLFVEQNTDSRQEEKEQGKDAFTCGMGITRIDVGINELGQPEITETHVDALEMAPDPLSRRYNWNEDARFICHAKWVDPDEIKELYPEHANQVDALFESDVEHYGYLAEIDSFKKEGFINNFVDTENQKVRLIECWYKEKKKKTIVFMPDGEIIKEDNLKKSDINNLKKLGGTVINDIEERMRFALFTANVLLEDDESPYDHNLFPYVPYFVDRKKSGEPFSMIWAGMTLQDAINHRESRAIYLLNNNQMIYETGAVRNKAEAAGESARADGQIEVQQGYFDRFRIDKNLELAASQFQMHIASINDFKRSVGIDPDAAQEKKDTRSGVGIARIQARSDLPLAPVFENFTITRKIKAKIFHHLIRQFHNEEMTFSITDDLNKARTIILNQKLVNPLTGEIIISNNVNKEAIFDIVVTNDEDTETVQQEHFRNITDTLPKILPFGTAWAKILFQASDIRNKQEIVQQIEEMTQPQPPDPKVSLSLVWNELTPEEKAAWAMKLGMQDLAQFEMQNGGDPAHIVRAKVDLAKEQGKQESDQLKAQADLSKEFLKGENAKRNNRES